MVQRIGLVETLLLLLDHFGTIRDTIRSKVAATGIEQIQTLKVNHMPKLSRK